MKYRVSLQVTVDVEATSRDHAEVQALEWLDTPGLSVESVELLEPDTDPGLFD